MAEEASQEQIDKEIEHFKAHLLSVCSALGGVDRRTGLYVPGDEVMDCLKDLKRYLKDEDGQVIIALYLIYQGTSSCIHLLIGMESYFRSLYSAHPS
jgi:hypothetical protein